MVCGVVGNIFVKDYFGEAYSCKDYVVEGVASFFCFQRFSGACEVQD